MHLDYLTFPQDMRLKHKNTKEVSWERTNVGKQKAHRQWRWRGERKKVQRLGRWCVCVCVCNRWFIVKELVFLRGGVLCCLLKGAPIGELMVWYVTQKSTSGIWAHSIFNVTTTPSVKEWYSLKCHMSQMLNKPQDPNSSSANIWC